jgi:hypothetical protein
LSFLGKIIQTEGLKMFNYINRLKFVSAKIEERFPLLHHDNLKRNTTHDVQKDAVADSVKSAGPESLNVGEENGNEAASLQEFYQGISKDKNDKVLVIVGGGTAGLTYLSTAEIDPKYTHVVILGGQGYWSKASHRLAQPAHILALPHQTSAEFIDPAAHDESNQISPLDPRSAYMHSQDYQYQLKKLEDFTCDSLRQSGRQIYIAREITVQKIDVDDSDSQYWLKTAQLDRPIFANKLVVASGAGPGRKLPQNVFSNTSVSENEKSIEAAHIVSYTDILIPEIAEKIRGKEVIISGGGPTAAGQLRCANRLQSPSHGSPETVSARQIVQAQG